MTECLWFPYQPSNRWNSETVKKAEEAYRWFRFVGRLNTFAQTRTLPWHHDWLPCRSSSWKRHVLVNIKHQKSNWKWHRKFEYEFCSYEIFNSESYNFLRHIINGKKKKSIFLFIYFLKKNNKTSFWRIYISFISSYDVNP